MTGVQTCALPIYDEARYWVQQILEKKRTLPLYKEHIERPWFRKEKALLKELAVSWAQAVVRQLQSISSYASSSASLFPASPAHGPVVRPDPEDC